MSYATVVQGLHERFATVSGLKAILDYEPTTIHEPPILYTLLDRVERSQGGQVTTMRYRVLNRVIIRWQDNERAEQELMPFVNSVAAAIDASPQLGNRLQSGIARVDDIQAVFVRIGNTLYRALDIYADIVEKGAYQGGL